MSNPSQQPRGLDKASPQIYEQLRDFLRGDVYCGALQDLQSESPTSLLESPDNVLAGTSDCAIPKLQESLHELSEICGVKEVLPKSWTLSESLLGCVYKGTFNGSKVRIRRVRMYSEGDPQKVEAFRKAALISKHSAHPNIVPFLGVTTNPLELISAWIPDLPRYIAKHPDPNRLSLLSDVAEGLNYLHSCDVIHGDLKGSNILVDATDHARITDFGLALVTQDLDLMRNAWAEGDRSAGWIAPEILDGGTYSKEADIFSFAGLTIEAFTGAVPFSDKQPHEVDSAVECPPRLIHPTLTDWICALIRLCWNKEARRRPHALMVSCGFNSIPAWKCLADRSITLNERISLIMDHNDTEAARLLPRDDAQLLVNEIDKMLKADTLTPLNRRKCVSALRTICGQQALLPRSVQITPNFNRPPYTQYGGGHADVWEDKYQGRKVAVKFLKIYGSSDLDEIRGRFCKEVLMWKDLDHENVLPLLGATMSDNHFIMISEWMDNGNINEFIKAHQRANRFELLKNVTSGLMYLHNEGVIHGDLKGANILINRNRHACLADFGLLTFAPDPTNPTTSISTTNSHGTMRWMSPELLDPKRFGFQDCLKTNKSDCYALGMVILEVLSGQVPFVGDSDFAVMRKATDGEVPQKPEAEWFTDNVWEVLKGCWALNPPGRPSLEVVFQCLKNASWPTLLRPVPSTANSFEEELPHQEDILTTDVSWVTSPSPEAVSQPAQAPTPHGASAGWDNTQELARLDTTSTWFSGQGSDDFIRKDLDIEYLDKALDDLSPAGFTFKRTHRKLQRICVFRNLLPSSHVLLDNVLNIDEHPFASSSFSDAYKGSYNNLQVCVKKLRAPNTNLEQAKKMPLREALMWKRLIHPNVVPFIGVIIDPPQIAAHWMPGGNLTAYIKSNPHKDPLSLLVDVAKGLDYIHSHGVIHGDLKGPNIFVDFSGHARITDFGLAQNVLDVVTIPERRSVQWTAPEVLEETGTPSTETDVFSFGMVMVEAFTGMPPFSTHNSPAAMMAIINGEHPPRPNHTGVTDRLWELMNRCWDKDRHNRPSVLEVLFTLNPRGHEYIQQRLENLDPLGEEYRPLLYALLSHRDLGLHIDNPRKDDLLGFVELLNDALNHIPVTDDLFRKTLRRLRSTCDNHEVLPQSYFIPGGKLTNRGEQFAAGGSADEYGAEFDGNRVCIKTLRSNVQSQTFYGRLIVWKRLQHPNIVPLLGISAYMSPLEIVCDWMENGSITEYVRRHQRVDPIGLLWDVAEGLHHLHSYNIVHGDLKAANVLIDESGHARLTNFGLASTVLGNQSVVSLPDASSTIARTWAAPEISKGGSVTKAGDVFTFAMVAAETFTERSLSIYAAVLNEEHLERPERLRNDLWDLMQSCWNRDPRERPTSFKLVDFFRPSFLREQEISDTQTLSTALSDETLASPEGGSTGSHSDVSSGRPQTGKSLVQRVLNRPGSSSPIRLLQGLFSRPMAERRSSTPTDRSAVPDRPRPLSRSGSA